MKLIDIIEGLENKTITLDLKHHHCENDFVSILNRLKSKYSHYDDWLKSLESDSNSKDHTLIFARHQRDQEVLPGQYIEREQYCFDCGKTLAIMVVDDKNIALVDTLPMLKYREENKLEWNAPCPTDLITDCPAKEIRELGKIVTTIDVPSGELVFVNFFRKKEIRDFPEDHEYCDINDVLGRIKLSKYLETQNIGCGQMSNMYVGVFVKDTGDEILIASECSYNSETDEEEEVTYDGFTLVGMISCDMWRWMCGDLSILREHEEEIPDNLTVSTEHNENIEEFILTKVKPGKWTIEHYFEFFTDETTDTIYSRLFLTN